MKTTDIILVILQNGSTADKKKPIFQLFELAYCISRIKVELQGVTKMRTWTVDRKRLNSGL